MLRTGVGTATRKLVSRKGTLLGTISFPSEWAVEVERRGGLNVAMMPALRISDILGDPAGPVEPLVRTIAIFKAHDWTHRDAVRLEGVTLEEFEAMPDCSFAPSAAYLRTLVE